MRIKIEGTAAELAELEIVELGDEMADARDSRGFERERPQDAAQRAAVVRARSSASLSPPSASVELARITSWMGERRGWSHQVVALATDQGAPPRYALRALFEHFGGAGHLAGASVEVWIDIGGGAFKAMLPPNHKVIPELDAELSDLRIMVARAGIPTWKHEVI